MQILRYSVSDAVELRNGIMFNFYLGLPHMDECLVYSGTPLNGHP